MFPDTGNFTDPAYTGGDPLAPPDINAPSPVPGIGSSLPGFGDAVPSNPSTDLGLSNGAWGVPGWDGIAPSTGGAASNTPAQGSSTGSKVLGWLGLANNVTNTALNQSRTGGTSRPGVRPSSSLGSFGTVTTTTLLVIVAVFVGVLFLLRK